MPNGCAHGGFLVGKILRPLAQIAFTVGGFLIAGPLGATVGAAVGSLAVSTLLPVKAKGLSGQLSRLNVTLDTAAPRKMVLGETAMGLDLRYQAPDGTDQEYHEYVIAVAAHEVEAIDQIWFDDRLAWSGGTVQSAFSGYLTVDTRLVGTAANAIAINSEWTTSCRLTGCAYVRLRIKRSGNTKKAESPLVNGLPSRVTIRGKGLKLYDPRLDGTRGGTGPHRADDQTTWGTTGGRDNPALQLLAYLLGWKIGGKLSVGCGVPVERIDFGSFITAANVCDESVALAAGGTQPRYRSAGLVSEADSRDAVLAALLDACRGSLRDSGGLLSLHILKNDLAAYVLDLTDDDVLGSYQWQQTEEIGDAVNVVRGTYTDASDAGLYQQVDYPQISIASFDGIERVLSFNLPFVQNVARAQRLAKQELQAAQYQGRFSAEFSHRALGCQVGEIVRLTFAALGWSNKPFRVMEQALTQDLRIAMTLREENAAIYAWDAEDAPGVTPAAPVVYDPLNNPIVAGIAEAESAAAQIVVASNVVQVACSFDGTVKTGQLPRSVQATRYRAAVDVSSSTAWSVTPTTGITASISSTGLVSITAASADGSVRVSGTRDGVLTEATIDVRRVFDAIPATGGAGASSATTTMINPCSAATYGAANTDVLTVRAPASGIINLSAPLNFEGDAVAPADLAVPAWGKWQWRIVAGTWADVATEIASTVSAKVINEGGGVYGSGQTGAISVAQSKTGLTSGRDYEFRLRLRGDDTRARYFVGAASAVQA